MLEYLVRVDAIIRKTSEQKNPVVLWVDDTEHPGVVRLERKNPEIEPHNEEFWLLTRAEQQAAANDDKSGSGDSEGVLSRLKKTVLPLVVTPDAESDLNEGHLVELPEEHFNDASETDDFQQAMQATDVVIRSWDELDELLARLHGCASTGWYVYQVGDTPPEAPLESQPMHRFLLDIDASLRLECDQSSCGIVFVDDLQRPTFVKVYHPGAEVEDAGKTLPVWTISRLKPVETVSPALANKKFGWRSLFHW